VSLVQRLLRALFYLLYHPLAFTYDLVAAVVSLGRWNDWVLAVIPFVQEPRVLELGFGPGHLQRILRGRTSESFGLDESRQMVAIARRRLRADGHKKLNLSRGLAHHLPFPAGHFNTLVSTFPSEYIFTARALQEAWRVLGAGGRLVILPAAWHVGRGLFERGLAWVFRITGETPGPFDAMGNRFRNPLEAAGFRVEVLKSEVRASLLLILIAAKPL